MDTATALAPFEFSETELDSDEQLFLYNLEVLGLHVLRAGEMAGVKSPYHVLKKPHIMEARERLRIAMRGRTDFTREDIVAGFKHAIDQADTLADPMAQIAGWKEIAKIKGFDKAPNINIHLTGTIENMKRQIQSLPTDELMRMSGDNSVIDADFYQVHTDAPAE